MHQLATLPPATTTAPRGLEVDVLSCRRGPAVDDEPFLDGSRQANEGLVDVDVILGGALPKVNAELPGELLALLRGDDLLVEHVALVTGEELVHSDVGVLLDLSDPVPDGLEGAAVRDVVDEEDALRSAKVGRGDGPEPFLAGCVPNLQLDPLAIDVDVLDLKVNPDGRDEGRAERVIGISQEEASLPDAGVADH